MTKILQKTHNIFRLSLIIFMLTVSMLMGAIILLSFAANPIPTGILPPTSQLPNTQYEAAAPPSPYPTYTGSGTARTAQESLWTTFNTGGNATNGLPLVVNLPGTGYWTGTRIDVTVQNIFEQKDWITNGEFEGGFSSWTTYNDNGAHTGPNIAISNPDVGGLQHKVASFDFAPGTVISDQPPKSSSTTASNEGDVGGTTQWTFGTSGISNAAGVNCGRVTGRNSGGSNNRDGVVEFYLYDYEAHADPDVYTATFTATYTYYYDEFPVSSASFSFNYYYYSLDFNGGNPSSQCGYEGDLDRFVFTYQVFTMTASTSEITVADLSFAGATSPGDSGWITNTPIDISNLFTLEVLGSNFRVVFKLVVYMDVDDGKIYEETSHDTWCNSEYACNDKNNEDSDYLYFWIDGLELISNIPQFYGGDINPAIYQTFTFDKRNTTTGYLQVDYLIPTTFFCGKTTPDNGICLDIWVNSKLNRYYFSSLIRTGTWQRIQIDYVNLGLPVNPGPTSITVNISVVFTVSGWYAQGVGQSARINRVILYLENYAPANIALLTCYDVEHSTTIGWNSITEYQCSFTNYNTWQTGGIDSSTFWLNTTSTAKIWLQLVTVTFYADIHYPSVTPIYSLPTDADGRTDTVTWTITYNVQAIASGWRYNLTIPSIPNWASNDWDVVSVKDPTNQDIDYWEYAAGGGMKNISIYETNEDTTGNWVITCTSPNKIMDFNVTNQASSVSYEYYPGFTNQSRIGFTTGVRHSTSSLIMVNYTDPTGTPVSGTYPDTTIQPATSYQMTYWTIPDDAVANDHYIAMVKWVDTDGFNDEVGFAAHYIQIYRSVSVGSTQFLQSFTLSSSNIVLAGEPLKISVDITDALVNPSLQVDTATLVIDYPNKINRSAILQKTLTMTKSGNTYSYTLETDGVLGDNWLIADAWMGGTGNRTFSINLGSNSTYFNGIFQTYQRTGWFLIVVDTDYNLPIPSTQVEQGISFTLTVELLDKTPSHGPAFTGIPDSDKINNRTEGSPITDFNGDGKADTWNGSVFMHWNIVSENLTNWCGGDISKSYNNPNYQWNGTLELKEGYDNRYETRIRVPYDAVDTKDNPSWWYFINITTVILDNEWGWQFEVLYLTAAFDNGPNIVKNYDNHKACFKLDVIKATGHTTKLQVSPANTLSTPLEFYWNNESADLTRLYVRFYNTSNNIGFNSTFLNAIDNWAVESWSSDPKIPPVFGMEASRLQWSHCDSALLLPDGITPDPHRENLNVNSTWGWFYADFNWTLVDLGLGTYSAGLNPAGFEIYLYAKVENMTNKYRSSETTHFIKVLPNPVSLTIKLKYSGNPTFLDENYYPGQMTDDYYWGDILNFTIFAQDQINNISAEGISLRYYIYLQPSEIIVWGNVTERSSGYYSILFNTSDPNNLLGNGVYEIDFRGVLMNRTILKIEGANMKLSRRNTQLWPVQISGIFDEDSVNHYAEIEDIRQTRLAREFDPIETVMTAPNEIILFNVTVIDDTPRNYTSTNIIRDANISWYLRPRGAAETQWRLAGWSNTPDVNGVYTFTVDLSQMNPAFTSGEYGDTFELHIIPYKPNFDSTEDTRYQQNNPGSAWKQYIVIEKRPIALIPVDISGTPLWDYQHSQSNWYNNPIYFVVMDLISGENVSGCTITYQIGEDIGIMNETSAIPGWYHVIYDTWPSWFQWTSGGQKYLEAQILYGPPSGDYGTYGSESWDIARLTGNFKVSVYVESEGFFGPLTVYFWIVLGCVGAVLGSYYFYKSYKFLTTPYVIRKIEESIDKISKDKKIAAGVMKSRDHLVFLEATELLQVVGIALKPPPEKKLPPPIEKLAPKISAKEAEKIPEIPTEIVSAELDKAGVRPEEKPILLQQIAELGPADRLEFIESLIGEDRFEELIEDLKTKQKSGKT